MLALTEVGVGDDTLLAAVTAPTALRVEDDGPALVRRTGKLHKTPAVDGRAAMGLSANHMSTLCGHRLLSIFFNGGRTFFSLTPNNVIMNNREQYSSFSHQLCHLHYSIKISL